MTKEKQIDNISQIITNVCESRNVISSHKLAKSIYDRGYRYGPDVARELLYDVEIVLNNVGYFDVVDFHRLQRKYLGVNYNDFKKTH